MELRGQLNFKIADYLLPKKFLELEDQREIFRIRSKTNRLPSNWGETVPCETACGQNLNNEHILSCSILNDPKSKDLELNMIYNGNVEEKIKSTSRIYKQYGKEKQIPSSGFIVHVCFVNPLTSLYQ